MKLRAGSIENDSSEPLFLPIFKFHIGGIARTFDPGDAATILLDNTSAE